jgi:hypothetical protein
VPYALGGTALLLIGQFAAVKLDFQHFATKPARRLWPANAAALRPSLAAPAFTMAATLEAPRRALQRRRVIFQHSLPGPLRPRACGNRHVIRGTASRELLAR